MTGISLRSKGTIYQNNAALSMLLLDQAAEPPLQKKQGATSILPQHPQTMSKKGTFYSQTGSNLNTIDEERTAKRNLSNSVAKSRVSMGQATFKQQVGNRRRR